MSVYLINTVKQYDFRVYIHCMQEIYKIVKIFLRKFIFVILLKRFLGVYLN